MLSPEKVATPATAATVFVPDRVPVPGFVPIATVMLPVNPVAVFPWPSWAVTWTAGVIAAPATALVRSEERRGGKEGTAGMSNEELQVIPGPEAGRVVT